MRRRGLCGSGLIAEASAAVSRARVSTICWSISTCHVVGFFAGAVLDYSAGFSLPMPDAETSISEEPGAQKGTPGSVRGRFGQLAVLPRCRTPANRAFLFGLR